MNKLHKVFYNLVLAWIIAAFSLQMYFVYLHFTGMRDTANRIAAKISKQPW